MGRLIVRDWPAVLDDDRLDSPGLDPLFVLDMPVVLGDDRLEDPGLDPLLVRDPLLLDIDREGGSKDVSMVGSDTIDSSSVSSDRFLVSMWDTGWATLPY